MEVYPIVAQHSVRAVDHWRAARAIQHIPTSLQVISDLLPDLEMRISSHKWKQFASARTRARNSRKIKQTQKQEQLDAARKCIKRTAAGWWPLFVQNHQAISQMEG